MNHSHHDHEHPGCCAHPKSRIDYLFWGSLTAVLAGYILHLLKIDFNIHHLAMYNDSVFTTINKMWWGVLLGIFFVGILELAPKESINRAFGNDKGIKGIIRAAIAGIVFDLCSHGILLVAMKLYKKGVSVPQLMTFLIASPWNSISLTIILFSLIGFKWTALFIVLSFLVAVASGMVFQILTDKKIIPSNPNVKEFVTDIGFIEAFKKKHEGRIFNFPFFLNLVKETVKESEMILRWVFLGVVIAALIRAFVPDVTFAHYFGASILGIFMTLFATTIIEVCSEGSVPIAADILNRAMAPGNAFVFLMAGVATDYTEIMALRQTTGSWKTTLFLPLVTVPQIIILGYLLNLYR